MYLEKISCKFNMNFRNYSKFSICYGKYFISHDYLLFVLTCDWATITIKKDFDINWFWTWNNEKGKCILTWKFSSKNFIMKGIGNFHWCLSLMILMSLIPVNLLQILICIAITRKKISIYLKISKLVNREIFLLLKYDIWFNLYIHFKLLLSEI